jgi:hypothetical protein
MSRKPRRASPSARPTSADTLFRQLPTVEHTAYLVLNALDHVVDVAGRFAPGAKRIEFGPDLADVPERDRPTELSLPTRPVHGLLAACIAFVQTEFWGHLPKPIWISTPSCPPPAGAQWSHFRVASALRP